MNIEYCIVINYIVDFKYAKSKSVGELSLSFFDNGFLNTITRGEFNPSLLTLTQDEDVT